MDLFQRLEPTCGECPNLGDAIDSGVRYCWGEMTWRWPDEQVLGCVYRGRSMARHAPSAARRSEAIRDLLEHPRHSIDADGQKWLRAELRHAVARERSEHLSPRQVVQPIREDLS